MSNDRTADQTRALVAVTAAKSFAVRPSLTPAERREYLAAACVVYGCDVTPDLMAFATAFADHLSQCETEMRETIRKFAPVLEVPLSLFTAETIWDALDDAQKERFTKMEIARQLIAAMESGTGRKA